MATAAASEADLTRGELKNIFVSELLKFSLFFEMSLVLTAAADEDDDDWVNIAVAERLFFKPKLEF